jgi:hypothetical protein
MWWLESAVRCREDGHPSGCGAHALVRGRRCLRGSAAAVSALSPNLRDAASLRGQALHRKAVWLVQRCAGVLPLL